MRRVMTGLAAAVALAAGAATGPVAKVERVNGGPTVTVNGEVIPPMTMTAALDRRMTPDEHRGYYRRLGEAGMRVFYVGADTRWLNPGDPATGAPDGVEAALHDIRFVLDEVPEAWIVLRLVVSPPRDWVNAHPEEQLKYSDGSHRSVICTSVTRKQRLDGMYSLCSEAWRREADKAIADFFAELSKHPEFARVIGTFLCSGGTSEWYYPGKLETPDGAYADFSEPFRREYEGYLRRKYGTVEKLRAAWRNPAATFEHPLVPTVEERRFTEKADEDIMAGIRDWQSQRTYQCLTNLVDANPRAETAHGIFLNANEYRHVADFYGAWHEGTARTIVHFARTLKRLRPNLLVGAFYGATAATSFFDGGTATGTRTILDSGAVDLLAAPGTYHNRWPGGVTCQREMQDSFRLRDLVYVCEDDQRTHRSTHWNAREGMGLYGPEDAAKILKRDFGRNICEDVRGWWLEMGGGWYDPVLWYDDPSVLALFARQQEIAREAYAHDRTKRNEIAVFFSLRGGHFVSRQHTRYVVDMFRTSDLHRIGAPVDWYFTEDLANPKMPDYKLYVMLYTYAMTDADREAIRAKARRNGATVLWFYAAGYVDEALDAPIDAANVSRTVGMTVKAVEQTAYPHFRVDPKSDPLVAGASRTRRYGAIDRPIRNIISQSRAAIPDAAYVNPRFHVEDPRAKALGRYCNDGKVALASVKADGFTSVYCGAAVMRSDLLASIARAAGCHVYNEKDDVLYANERYVTVHAKDDGPRTIRFKRPCSPYEVYERKSYGKGVTEITVDMELGDTLMWRLDEP